MQGNNKSEIAVNSISYLDSKIMKLEFEEKYKARMHNRAVSWVMRHIMSIVDSAEADRVELLDNWFKSAITEIIQEI